MELARRAATPLTGDTSQDISISLPWNISAVARQCQKGLHSRSTFGRSSRRTTPSPSVLSRRNILGNSPIANNLDLGDHGFSSPLAASEDGHKVVDDPETEGRERNTNDKNGPLQVKQSDVESLDTESSNFLDYVYQKLKNQPIGRVLRGEKYITFKDLLPTEHISRQTAVHGFVNLLSLSSKSILTVEQQQSFGQIIIQLTDNVETFTDDNA